MTEPTGGFYSAEDHDREGEEGKFYVWGQDEIRQTLNREEADLFIRVFNVEKDGNFRDEATSQETGKNILHLKKPLKELASELKMPEQDIQMRVNKARKKLFAAREKRIHPYKDDKILTDWNGLMVAALAKGARAFDDPRYAEAAKGCVDFILKSMRDRGDRLFHRYREGEAAVMAYIDDYAFLTWGLLELYETTFDVSYIQAALDFNKVLFEHFWDEQGGGFYFTPDDGEDLIVRSKEVYDGAVPSGNSVAMLNLLRLGRMTANSDLEENAARIGRAFSSGVRQSPSGYTQLMVAVDFGIGPSYEVVLAGDSEADDTKAMLKSMRARFVPNKVVLLRPSEQESPDIIRVAPFTEGQTSIDGKATAYVCRDYVCKLPTTDADKMLELLNITNSNSTLFKRST